MFAGVEVFEEAVAKGMGGEGVGLVAQCEFVRGKRETISATGWGSRVAEAMSSGVAMVGQALRKTALLQWWGGPSFSW